MKKPYSPPTLRRITPTFRQRFAFWRMRVALMLGLAALMVACSQPSAPNDAGPLIMLNWHPPVPAADVSPLASAPVEPTPSPKADVRTAKQLALAACEGPGGAWYCPSIQRPLRGSASQPIIPPSWTVPAWYQDGGNSTGCASDNNSCTSATCGTGGIGPCLTLNEIRVHRWGGVPQLQQTTTINILSSETVGQEEVPLSVAVAGPYQFILQGTRSLVTTLTPTGLTAMNRSTPQLLQITVSSAAGLAAGQLAVNNTRSSRALIENVNGTTITISEPFNNQTLSACGRGSHCAPTEDNGWAATDSLSFYTFPLLNLTAFDLRGGLNGSSPFVGGVGIMQYIQIPDSASITGGSIFAPTSPDGYFVLLDDDVRPNLLLAGPQNEGFTTFARGINLYSSAFALSNAELDGGVQWQTILTPNMQVGGVLDGDIILLGGLQTYSGRNDVSNVYIGSGSNIILSSGSNMNWRAGINAEWLWGPGGINVRSGATFSDGAAVSYVSNFLLKGTMNLNGSVTTCSYYSGGTWTSGAALNQTTIDTHGGCGNPQTNSWFTTLQ